MMKSFLVFVFAVYVISQIVVLRYTIWEGSAAAPSKATPIVQHFRSMHGVIAANVTSFPKESVVKRTSSYFISTETVNVVDVTEVKTTSAEQIHHFYGPMGQSSWKERAACSGDFRGFGKYLAVWKNMILDKSKIIGRSGGESLSSVMGIKEDDEYLKLEKGTFIIDCRSDKPTTVLEKDLNSFMAAVDYNESSLSKYVSVDNSPTLLLVRIEYANVYWTIIDIYNAYLTTRDLGLEPKDCTILLFDGHPTGHLDTMWSLVFGRVLRVKDLQPATQFKTLIWQHLRYHTPFLKKDLMHKPPYFDNFIFSVHSSCGIAEMPVHCQKPFVLFIWRHNYIAHARNPGGLVKRKIANEEELIQTTRQSFPNFQVEGHQLDNLTICAQVALVSKADIIVAMHGAALAFTTFMKPSSGLIEIYPPSYKFPSNWHMTKIAEWKNVHSLVWSITDSRLENLALEETRVPPNDLMFRIRSIASKTCPV